MRGNKGFGEPGGIPGVSSRHFPRRVSGLIVAASLVVTLASGCGGTANLPKTVPVTGVVKYKGEPLPRGEVMFVPEKGGGVGRSSLGKIGEDGRYQLTTFEPGDGAPPGKYEIAVMCLKDPEPPTKEELANPNPPAAPKQGKPWIPERYFHPKASKLTATVGDSATVVDLEITD